MSEFPLPPTSPVATLGAGGREWWLWAGEQSGRNRCFQIQLLGHLAVLSGRCSLCDLSQRAPQNVHFDDKEKSVQSGFALKQ